MLDFDSLMVSAPCRVDMHQAEQDLAQPGGTERGRTDGVHSRKHLAQLESLRGLGTLMVAALHCSQAGFAPQRTLRTAAGENLAGRIGVDVYRVFFNGHGALIMFFVISGFVLTRSLEAGPKKLGPVAKRYFTARLFRIYPAIISTVSLLWLLYLIFGWMVPGVQPSAYAPMHVLRNALLWETSIDGVMWSLQVELVAVVVIFLVARLQPFCRFTAIGVLLLLTVLSFWKPWFDLLGQGTYFGWIFAFVFGIALQVHPAFWRRFLEQGYPWLFFLSIVVFFGARPISPHWAPLLECCASSVIIAVLAYRPASIASRLLDSAFLEFYGRISYSFYLLHPLSLIVLWNIPRQINWLRAAGLPNAAIALGLFIISSAAITPLAWLSWRYVEITGIDLGRRLVGDRRRFKGEPLPTPP